MKSIQSIFYLFITHNRQPMIDAVLSMSMAMLHGIYLNIPLRRCILDATMCALFAWGGRDIIIMMGWQLKWADIISVCIGFLGTDYIWNILLLIISKLINIKGGS